MVSAKAEVPSAQAVSYEAHVVGTGGQHRRPENGDRTRTRADSRTGGRAAKNTEWWLRVNDLQVALTGLRTPTRTLRLKREIGHTAYDTSFNVVAVTSLTGGTRKRGVVPVHVFVVGCASIAHKRVVGRVRIYVARRTRVAGNRVCDIVRVRVARGAGVAGNCGCDVVRVRVTRRASIAAEGA